CEANWRPWLSRLFADWSLTRLRGSVAVPGEKRRHSRRRFSEVGAALFIEGAYAFAPVADARIEHCQRFDIVSLERGGPAVAQQHLPHQPDRNRRTIAHQ